MTNTRLADDRRVGVGSGAATIHPADPSTGSLPEGAVLAPLVAALERVDDGVRAALEVLGQLDGRQVVREEGMGLEAAVRLHSGAAPGDVAMLLTAHEVLRTMPVTASLFARGVLSWGHVRALVAGARRFDVTTRAALDRHLGEHADRLGRLDGDGLLGAIDDALVQHEPARNVDRRHSSEQETLNVFCLQGRLDGTSESWGRWDREATTLLADALQAEADAPQAAPCPGDQDAPQLAPVGRARQLGEALLRVVTRGRAGQDRPTPPVRFTVVVDADRVCDQTAGLLQTALRSRPPRVVRRTLDRLACDAAIDAVVRDGTDLIAAQRYAAEVTAATRRAVTARDLGCRFPGCTAPVGWCDVHHVSERATGDDHALSNLVLLCRRHHTIVHRRGWRQTLTADGTYTLRRHGRTWTTHPRLHTTLPPPGRDGPARDGGNRDGPGARDGQTRAAPARDGPARDGPARDGPVSDPDLPF